MGGKMSISVVKGRGSTHHNNRDFVTPNVDKDRIEDNITYKRESLEDAYEHCFGKAIEKYNAKQKRADRRIDGAKGYMEQIKNSGNGEKLFYENVVQVGNMYDCGVGTESGETAKRILDTYMKEFEEKNPNLYVFNAVMHLDEKTPHLHIDYIPLAHGYQRGLEVRNSLDRAFKEQGIDGQANKYQNSTIAWQNREKDRIESIMHEHGLERAEDIGLNRKHMTVENYKAQVEIIDSRLDKHKVELECKPAFFKPRERLVISPEAKEKIEHQATVNREREKVLKKAINLVEKKRDSLKDREQAFESRKNELEIKVARLERQNYELEEKNLKLEFGNKELTFELATVVDGLVERYNAPGVSQEEKDYYQELLKSANLEKVQLDKPQHEEPTRTNSLGIKPREHVNDMNKKQSYESVLARLEQNKAKAAKEGMAGLEKEGKIKTNVKTR